MTIKSVVLGSMKIFIQIMVLAALLYLGTYIIQYGIIMFMCLILLVFGAFLLGSLLYTYIDGLFNCARLWSLTREQRQMHHAKNLPVYSIIPLNPEKGFRRWNEFQWRGLANSTGDLLSESIKRKEMFVRQVDDCIVRSGWPTLEEVERADNTIVLTVRDNWAGLAARINPVLNTFLNRILHCWNRSLVYTSIRFSSYGLPFPVVCTDFPTADVATLNFGQKDDCLLMSYVYERVRQTYPKAKIILLSICLGGLRILNWLSRNPNPENVIGVVLESPLASLKHMMIGSLGRWAAETLYSLFCLHVPNFRPELETQYSYFRPFEDDKDLPKDRICQIPLMVGVLNSDPYSNQSHIPLLNARFRNLTVFASLATHHGAKRLVHGMLYKVPEYTLAVQKFLVEKVLNNGNGSKFSDHYDQPHKENKNQQNRQNNQNEVIH